MDRFVAISPQVQRLWVESISTVREENELSLKQGFRLLSAYHLQDGVKMWIITEADISATTVL
jgi:hypothetical protein